MSMVARSRALDLLKIAMAVMVVGIHSNPFHPFGRTAILLTGEGIYRLAVPVFFVINGYFFYSTARSGRVIGYLRRTATLFALWMVIYLPISWVYYAAQTPLGFWRELLLGYWHLWYLSGLTLAAALAGLTRHWSTAALLTLGGICYLIGAAITWGVAWDQIDPWVSPHFHRNGLTLGLPFLLLGYLIRRHDLVGRCDLRALAIAATGAVALVLAESLGLARIAPLGVGHDNLLSLLLAAPLLVMLALKLPGSSGPSLGLWSSGLYFTHIIPCALLFRLTDLSHPVIFGLTLVTALAMTGLLIRTGLARRLF